MGLLFAFKGVALWIDDRRGYITKGWGIRE
jgi:hypothetical protein